jgi:hypothetical protein
LRGSNVQLDISAGPVPPAGTILEVVFTSNDPGFPNLGAATAATDGSGHAIFTLTIPLAIAVGAVITATVAFQDQTTFGSDRCQANIFVETPPSGSQTFDFTGAEQQFIVPAGVTQVTIQAWAAQGGAGQQVAGGSGDGGNGGFVQATIAVTPGGTLFIYVGGRGGNGVGTVGGAGGFNSGGRGGDGSFPGAGGGGGGASDVRRGGNTLNDRVVVAGAGGGGGSIVAGGDGGGGGDLSGGNGSNATTGATGGGGGTQAAGGTGGAGGVPAGPAGVAGGLGSGGAGGTGSAVGGGGGGSGFFGGGGGQGASFGEGSSGGGGGGSSFTIPGATGVIHQQGARTGDGQVVISF